MLPLLWSLAILLVLVVVVFLQYRKLVLVIIHIDEGGYVIASVRLSIRPFVSSLFLEPTDH